MARVDPPLVAGELDMLLGWLDFQRESIVSKLEGVSEEKARWRPGPSQTSLIGLVNHLAYVERWWFQVAFLGEDAELPWRKDDRDPEFDVPAEQTIDKVVAFYRAEWERGNEIVRAAASLDELTTHERVEKRSLRWIVVHMIEETARHAGHADICRELIDGTVGV